VNKGTKDQRTIDSYLTNKLSDLASSKQGIADAGASSSNPSTGKSPTVNVASLGTTSPPNTTLQAPSSGRSQTVLGKLKDRFLKADAVKHE